MSDIDPLFRLRAWVHYVSANPLNDDQLLLANDVAALIERVEKAEAALREAKELAKRVSTPVNKTVYRYDPMAERDDPPYSVTELVDKDDAKEARAFLAKYGDGK